MTTLGSMTTAAQPAAWGGETSEPRRRSSGNAGLSRLALGGLIVAGGLWSSPSFAVPDEALRVEFSGPRECGAPERLLELTRELLGADADRAGVEVTAVVSAATERRYTLRLALRGAVQGRRTIAGANCDEALRAGAVVIALSINPNALSAPEEPEPAESVPPEAASPSVDESPESKPEPVAQPAVAEPTKAAPEPARPRAAPAAPDSDSGSSTDSASEVVLLGLAARAQYGLSPEPRFGARATFGVVWTNLLLRAQGYFDPANEHDSEAAGPVRFTSFGGGADVCARSSEWSGLSFAVCGGWLVTRVTASAPEVSSPATRDALVSAASVGLGLGLRLSQRWSLLAEGGVTIPTTRPRFTVDVAGTGPSVVHQVEPGALASLGLQWGI